MVKFSNVRARDGAVGIPGGGIAEIEYVGPFGDVLMMVRQILQDTWLKSPTMMKNAFWYVVLCLFDRGALLKCSLDFCLSWDVDCNQNDERELSRLVM